MNVSLTTELEKFVSDYFYHEEYFAVVQPS
jgi:hypothetical protein